MSFVALDATMTVESKKRESGVTVFRILLVGMLAVLSIYTAVVAAHHGLGLLPVFFGDMAKMQWPGQFDLDFMFMLTLSASWVAWRSRFSAGGMGLALLAFFLGSVFLAAYLLVVSVRSKGDMREVLLGKSRT